MNESTYNSLVYSTAILQRRFDLICKALKIENSNSIIETTTPTPPTPPTTDNSNTSTLDSSKSPNTEPVTNEINNPMISSNSYNENSDNNFLSLMYEGIIKATSPPSGST